MHVQRDGFRPLLDCLRDGEKGGVKIDRATAHSISSSRSTQDPSDPGTTATGSRSRSVLRAARPTSPDQAPTSGDTSWAGNGAPSRNASSTLRSGRNSGLNTGSGPALRAATAEAISALALGFLGPRLTTGTVAEAGSPKAIRRSMIRTNECRPLIPGVPTP